MNDPRDDPIRQIDREVIPRTTARNDDTMRKKCSRRIASGSDNQISFTIFWDPEKEVVRVRVGDMPHMHLIELPYSDVELIIDTMDDVFLEDWRSSGRPADTDDSRRSRLTFVLGKDGPVLTRIAPEFEDNIRMMGEDSCILIFMKDGTSVAIPSSSILRSGPVDGEDSYGFLTTDGIKVFRGDAVDHVMIVTDPHKE